jgi:hypothetical protein
VGGGGGRPYSRDTNNRIGSNPSNVQMQSIMYHVCGFEGFFFDRKFQEKDESR